MVILVDVYLYIGMDKLLWVIENMCNMIIECGGEVYFKIWMDVLIIEQGEVKGIEMNMGEIFFGLVILVIGYLVRDVYCWLVVNNVIIEVKGIVVGVCLEYFVGLID